MLENVCCIGLERTRKDECEEEVLSSENGLPTRFILFQAHWKDLGFRVSAD
jgi:hypothetical protein